MNDVKVSVLCLAYNHKDYIRKTLEGFVMQKTNFAFEVLIHDDASTDGTTEIIKEFEQLYPELIRPVYQKENQYSKGVQISRTMLIPIARGRYFAFCEGDDYWTEPNKLQKQYDFMTSHPNYGICVHQAVKHDCGNNKDIPMTEEKYDREFSVEEIILSGGSLFASNTTFMKREVYEEMPQCFYAKGFGDYQTFIHGAILGGCYYLADEMSVYNCGTSGSWTQRVEKNRKKRIEHYKEMIAMLKRVDAYYNLFYTDAIEDKISQTEYRLFKAEGKLIQIFRRKYKTYYEADLKAGTYPIKECIAARFPQLVMLKRKLVKW